MQPLGIGGTTSRSFGDAMITEKYYALTMVPGGKSGHTESVKKGKEMLLQARLQRRSVDSGKSTLRQSIQPGLTTQALGKAD
jgi:hypothetical protein